MKQDSSVTRDRNPTQIMLCTMSPGLPLSVCHFILEALYYIRTVYRFLHLANGGGSQN